MPRSARSILPWRGLALVLATLGVWGRFLRRNRGGMKTFHGIPGVGLRSLALFSSESPLSASFLSYCK